MSSASLRVCDRVTATSPKAHLVLGTAGILCLAVNQADAQNLPTPTPPVELPTPTSVAETPVRFSRGGLPLEGTLALPRSIALAQAQPEGHPSPGQVPLIIMVAGSGPLDRNANGPLTNTNAYAMLAWGLADRGIATFRYDKRGIGKSASAPPFVIWRLCLIGQSSRSTVAVSDSAASISA